MSFKSMSHEGKVKYCTNESSIFKDQDPQDELPVSMNIINQAKPIFVDALANNRMTLEPRWNFGHVDMRLSERRNMAGK